MTGVLRVATRGSALALAQAGAVAAALGRALGRPWELVPVLTRGDADPAPLDRIGGTGVFVVAVRQALLDGRADIAVHSLKDLPTAPHPGLVLAAVPPRADARDALCARDGLPLADLPAGARVGTGAPRRVAQLRGVRPDLELVPMRGNVDTRLGRVGRHLDAVVLARAGLERLGRLDAVTELFDVDVLLPAPGQGALAVERAAQAPPDPALQAALRAYDCPAARVAGQAERALLATLEAGCTAPVGAYAVVAEDGFWEPEVHLRAAVVALDGATSVRLSATGGAGDAEGLGRRLAADLLAAGAADLLGEPVP